MVINHNVSSLVTSNALNRKNSDVERASKRLSTGYRINSAADDSAGLAIAHKMKTQVIGSKMADRNTNDAISLIQTAEGGLNEVQNMLQRMRELAIQGANDTMGNDDREKIQAEIDQLIEEIDSTSTKVQFNKKLLLDGNPNGIGDNSLTFQVGPNKSMTVTLDMVKITAAGLTVDGLATQTNNYEKNETLDVRRGDIFTFNTDADVTLANTEAGIPSMSGNFVDGDKLTVGVGGTLVFDEKVDNIVTALGLIEGNIIEIDGKQLIIQKDTTTNTILPIGLEAGSKLTFVTGKTITFDAVTAPAPANGYNVTMYPSSVDTNYIFEIAANETFNIPAGTVFQLPADEVTVSNNTTISFSENDIITFEEIMVPAPNPPSQYSVKFDTTTEITTLSNDIITVPAGTILKFNAGDKIELSGIGGGQLTFIDELAFTPEAGNKPVTFVNGSEVTLSNGVGAPGATFTLKAPSTDPVSYITMTTGKDTTINFPAGYKTSVATGGTVEFDQANRVNFTAGTTVTVERRQPDGTYQKESIVVKQGGYVDVKAGDRLYFTAGDEITMSNGGDVKFLSGTTARFVPPSEDMKFPAGTTVEFSGGNTITFNDDTTSVTTAGGYATRDKCESAIKFCDDAIGIVSKFRAKLGAYQNRLEYTSASLQVSTENAEIALSRIEDTDMAMEMANYTKDNVIVQAATSMLAHANQRPQQVLQLLQ